MSIASVAPRTDRIDEHADQDADCRPGHEAERQVPSQDSASATPNQPPNPDPSPTYVIADERRE